MKIALTKKQKKCIRALEKVAEIWDEELWLYSGSSTLYVMKYGEDEHPVMKKLYKGQQGMGFDEDYIVATIDIPNDGGDW